MAFIKHVFVLLQKYCTFKQNIRLSQKKHCRISQYFSPPRPHDLSKITKGTVLSRGQMSKQHNTDVISSHQDIPLLALVSGQTGPNNRVYTDQTGNRTIRSGSVLVFILSTCFRSNITQKNLGFVSAAILVSKNFGLLLEIRAGGAKIKT